MKKEEIKKDLIHDKIINFINFITVNPKKTWGYLFAILTILLIFVVSNNIKETKKLSHNSYSSSHQNNFIDGNKELALIGFENIINNYSRSQAYNHAFLYLLSNAIQNNDSLEIIELSYNNSI